MTPSLDDVSIFVAVARLASISRAADQLQIPKSSVSRALARIEQAMGVELLYRTTRSARLSPAGEDLLQRTAPLVAALTEAVATLPDRERDPAGTLRITCTIDFGATVLADIVARFVARWPAVNVEVHASNAVVDLIAGGFDLALRFSPKRRLVASSLVGQRVGTLRTRLIASPEYLARRGAPRVPSDLRDHDWVTYRGAESIVLETPGGTAELAAHGRIRCDDMFFARAAARSGAGIVALPSFLADPDIKAGVLSSVLPKWQVPSGAIWLVHPPTRHLPSKVSAFRDAVAKALQKSAQ